MEKKRFVEFTEMDKQSKTNPPQAQNPQSPRRANRRLQYLGGM